jgi:PAS domain S-box-containing protein
VTDQPATAVVVDDAVEVRTLVRHQLARSGLFELLGEGSTGRDAIDLVARHRPALLLLDVSMPDLDGLEALPHVRAASPDTVVVMYTGFAESGLSGQAQALGATALIEKSASVGDLPAQLHAIVAAARNGDGAAAHAAAGHAEPPSPTGAGRPAESGEPSAAVLDEHLERFREVFEQAAIGMATLTRTGTIVRANRALAALVGRPIDDLVGRPYAGLAPAVDRAQVAAELTAVERGERDVVRFEHAVDGAVDARWLLATVAPVKDARGGPLYLFMQVQDVTSQRRAEEDLRQSEERFRLLVETVQDYAIFMLDPIGHVVSWNAGAERINGYRADEIIGRHFRTFYPGEARAIEHPEHELALALRDGHYEEEGWRLRKDGSRFWASVVITAVHNQAGVHVGFAKVTRDMSERRRLVLELEATADALASANSELEAANARLAREAAEQTQFMAVAAHELRTPVGVMSGSASLLAEHWAEMTPDERGEIFESVRLAAGRLQRLLSDLLAASRLELRRGGPVLQVADLGAVLEATIAASRATNPTAAVNLSGDVSGVRVVGEADRLGQLFDNLIANSIRHGQPPVDVRAEALGDRVQVTVSDAGHGVDEAVRERLFQRFASGGRRGGTGLGLFIVRELARAYGGDAWYAPEPDGSGRFVVSLVVAGDDHGGADASGAPDTPTGPASPAPSE